MRVKEISDSAERNPPPHVMSNLKIAHYAYRWSLIRFGRGAARGSKLAEDGYFSNLAVKCATREWTGSGGRQR